MFNETLFLVPTDSIDTLQSLRVPTGGWAPVRFSNCGVFVDCVFGYQDHLEDFSLVSLFHYSAGDRCGHGSPVLFVLHKPCKSLQSGRMFDKSLCVGAASAAGSPFKRIR